MLKDQKNNTEASSGFSCVNRKKVPTTRFVSGRVYDIVPPKNQIIRTSKNLLGIKNYSSPTKKVFGIGWRLVLAIFFVAFLFTGATPFDFLEAAGVAQKPNKKISFYAERALSFPAGVDNEIGWHEINQATGQADLQFYDDLKEFSQENSAVYKGGKFDLLLTRFTYDLAEQMPQREEAFNDSELSVGSSSTQNVKGEIDGEEEVEEGFGAISNSTEIDAIGSSSPLQVASSTSEKIASSVIELLFEDKLSTSSGLEIIGTEIPASSSVEIGTSVPFYYEEVEILSEPLSFDGLLSRVGSAIYGAFSEIKIGLSNQVHELVARANDIWSEEISEIGIQRLEELGRIEKAKVKLSMGIGTRASLELVEEQESRSFESVFGSSSLDFLFSSSSQVDVLASTSSQEAPSSSSLIKAQDNEGASSSQEEVELVEVIKKSATSSLEEAEVLIEPDRDESLFEQITSWLKPQESSAQKGEEKEGVTELVLWYSLGELASSSQDSSASGTDPIVWHELGVVKRENISNYINRGYFEYLVPGISTWEQVRHFKLKFEGKLLGQTQFEVFLDSAWLEIEYNPELEEKQLEKELELQEEIIEFVYTDENENENLIIRTDKKTYFDLSRAEVFFSVENISDTDETINVQALFPREKGEVVSIEKYDTSRKWRNIKTRKRALRDQRSVLKKIVGQAPKRKEAPQDFAVKAATDDEDGYLLQSQETAFFKMVIEYPVNSRGEFYIEVLGDDEGYGFLDPWWDSSWTYKLPITVDNSSSSTTLEEYQIFVELDDSYVDFWTNVDSSGDDIRFLNYDEDTELDHYVQLFNSTASSAAIWVQVDQINHSTSTIIYLYYGNNSAASQSDMYETFSYSTWKELYYVVNNDLTGVSVEVISLIDNNEVRLDSGATTSLDRQQTATLSSPSASSVLWAKGPVHVRLTGDDNVDALVPISFAADQFAVPSNRGTESYYLYSPFVTATTTVYDVTTQRGQNTLSQGQAGTISYNIATMGLVESTQPVLLSFDNDSPYDGYTPYPATTRDLYGIRSNSNFIGITENSTSFTIYCSSGTSAGANSLSRGSSYSNTTCSSSAEGAGNAVRLANINNPIGSVQQADSDGGETTTFLPAMEFASEYMVPTNAAYIAVACAPEYGSVDLRIYDESNVFVSGTNLTCTPSGNSPGKQYFGVADTTTYNAGSRIVSTNDKPFYAYYEDTEAPGSTGGDESNLWGAVQARQYTNDHPSYSIGAQDIVPIPLYRQQSYRFYANQNKTEIENILLENIEPKTTTDSTNYTNLVTASSSRFSASSQYFVYITAGFAAGAGSTNRVEYEIRYGSSVEYSGLIEPPGNGGDAYQISWMDVMTQGASPDDISLHFRANNGGMAYGLNAQILALGLDDLNADDWSFAEDSNSSIHTTSPSLVASTTLSSADGSKDWLIFASEEVEIANTSVGFQGEIYDGTNSYMAYEREGEYVGEKMPYTLFRSFADLPADSEIGLRVSDSSVGANTHAKSKIFALNLDAFESFKINYADINTSLAIDPSWTEISNLNSGGNYQPQSIGSQFIFASWINDAGSSGAQINDRLQVGGSTLPSSWSWTQSGVNNKTTYSVDDEIYSSIFALSPMTESGDTIDLDAQDMSISGRIADEVSLTVFSSLLKASSSNLLSPEYTPNNPWPALGSDISEDTALTSDLPVPGDVLRLRLGLEVYNSLAPIENDSFKLQFGEGAVCSAISVWTDLGQIASSTVWRGYDNAGLNDDEVLSTTTLSSSDLAISYQEENVATVTPKQIDENEQAEWDFVIENNGAKANTSYCFRMVKSDGTALNDYQDYPRVLTNSIPSSPTQDKLFDNEKIGSLTPSLEFSASDSEDDDLVYQVQWSEDYDFSASTTRRSDQDSGFVNISTVSDSSPFDSADSIRFTIQSGDALTNNASYWWRVRVIDPGGSNEWGEWSEKWSFSVDSSVSISTWYQTLEEQFDKGGLGNVTSENDQVELDTIIGEYGTTSVSGEATTTILLNRVYDNPIVVASPRYDSGNARTVRVTHKASSSFDIMVDDYGDGLAGVETGIDWLVMESGSSTIDNGGSGIKVVAGTKLVSALGGNNGGASWDSPETVSFSPNFDADPVVLHTVTSYNDTTWITSHVNDGSSYNGDPGTAQMGLILNYSKTPNDAHGSEYIDYIAFDTGNGTNNGSDFAVVKSSDTIAGFLNAPPYAVSYGSVFSDAPDVEISAQLGEDGGDGSWSMYYGGFGSSTALNFYTAVDEANSVTDRQHTTEPVGVVAFDSDGRGLINSNVISSGYVVGPSIDYSLGVNTAGWEEATFVDDETFGELLYQIEYHNGSSWALVPDLNIPGNSTGNGDSPIDLTNLNVYTFDKLRLRANFTYSGGSPILYDWGIEWKEPLRFEGTVYSDEGSSPLLTSPFVSLIIDGEFISSTTASAIDGSYTLLYDGYLPQGSSTLLYLDDSAEQGASYNHYSGSGHITAYDIYVDKVIVRHDDEQAMDISDIDLFDQDEDLDLSIQVQSGELQVDYGHEFYVWPSNSFNLPNATSTFYDLDVNGSLIATQTAPIIVTSNWDLEGGVFSSASSTVSFTATSSGKFIRVNENNFYSLVFDGAGGQWLLLDTATTSATSTLANGTLTQGGDVDLYLKDFFIQTGASFEKATSSGKIIFYGQEELYFSDQNSSLNNLGQLEVSESSTRLNLSSDLQVDNIVIQEPTYFYTRGYELSATEDILIYGTYDCLDTEEGDGTITEIAGDWLASSSASFIAGNSTTTFSGSASSTINTGGNDATHDFYNLEFAKTVLSTSTLEAYDLRVSNNLLIGAQSIFDVSSSSLDLSVGGSWENQGEFVAHNNTVTFDSLNTGNIILAGSSKFFNVIFDSASGGWLINENATSSANWTISEASSFQVASGVTVEVKGQFFNQVDQVSTDWTGSRLYLSNAQAYGTEINASTTSDQYGTLQLGPDTFVRMWNSSSSNYILEQNASLYSMDHSGIDGDLYVWGDYISTTSDYWSYATDFDGTNLGGGFERQANVRLADFASSTFTNASLAILGGAQASTTISAQSGGKYSLRVDGGSLSAEYFTIRDIDSQGLQLAGNLTVSTLESADLVLEEEGGAMLSVASTTIDANSGFTVNNFYFATSTGVSNGYNAKVLGSASGFWRFASYGGNYGGESFDFDTGGTCGSLRWYDSDCTDVVQKHYRWRNDDGGESLATWKAAEDTSIVDQNKNEKLRLRFSIDNIDLDSTGNIDYKLQSAELGAYANCSAIPSINYSRVSTSSQGSEYVLATSSSFYADHELTSAQLTAEGTFSNGYMVESPSNMATSVDLLSGEYSELEFAIAFTDQARHNAEYCFRLQQNDIDMTSYEAIPRVKIVGINISGYAYENRSGSTWSACDDSSENISLVIDSSFVASTSCASSDGAYQFTNVDFSDNDPLTLFFNANGGNLDEAAVVDLTENNYTSLNINITKGRSEVRAESGALTIDNSDLSHCHSGQGGECAQVPFLVQGSALRLSTSSSLFIASPSVFQPGGELILPSGAASSTGGGDIEIESGALLSAEDNDVYVGGDFLNYGNFTNSGSQTTYFTATSSAFQIRSGGVNFNDLVLSGQNGSWSFIDDTTIDGDLLVAAGTLYGTTSLTVYGGSASGNGTIDLTDGKFTLDGNGDFGGDSDWTFNDLEFGDGLWSAVTQKVGQGDISVTSVLRIQNSQVLYASSSTWTLSGSATPFNVLGGFDAQISTFQFSSTANTTVDSNTYYRLEIVPTGGNPTHTLSAGNLFVANYLKIGDGVNPVTFDADSSGPNLDINGDILISTSSSFSLPSGSVFNAGGSWRNYGSFTHNNGLVTFDASDDDNIILASSSAFYDIDFDNEQGSWELDGNLQAANDLSLISVDSFVASSSHAWYDSNWLYRKVITIDANQVIANMSNFPVLVSITDADIASSAQEDGDDILFTSLDGVNKLDHEIEFFSTTTEELIAWVKLENISSTTDTELIVYYGHSSASNQEAPASLWSDYVGVWHLSETPAVVDTDNVFEDSTSNNYDGGSYSSVLSSSSAMIGPGLDFSGASALVPISGHNYTSAGEISAVTVCSWINSLDTTTGIIDWDRSEYWSYGIDFGNTASPGLFTWDTAADSGGIHDFASTITVNDGAWHHICATFDSSATNDKKIYIDGQLNNEIDAYTTGDNLGTGAFTRYGYFGDGSEATTYNSLANGQIYDGYLDEVRITHQAKDLAWIKTEYNNQSSPNTFIKSVGSEQDYSPSGHITVEVNGQFSNQVSSASTTWYGSTLYLNGASSTINTKTSGGDTYYILKVGADTDVKAWNSDAVQFNIDSSGSLYSQDHASVDGELYIWGDYNVDSGTEYWSRSTDFDGASLSGSERSARVFLANQASVEIDNAELEILGSISQRSFINNQDGGSYSLTVRDSTINARYYNFDNLGAQGLYLTGSTTITSLDQGNYELDVNGGAMITLDPSVVNENGLTTIAACSFSLGDASSGYNVDLTGAANNVFVFQASLGDLDGDSYDNDPGDPRGFIIWDDSPDYAPLSQNWQWFNDAGDKTPTSSPAAPENTSPGTVGPSNSLKLRLTINETSGLGGENVKMRLQYSSYSDFSDDVNYVGEIGSTSIWTYYNGAGNDNEVISDRVLSDSSTNATHNESGVSTSSFDHLANEVGEWEFTVYNNGASDGVVYYFRAYADYFSVYDYFEQAVENNIGESYPSLTVASSTLSFSISGLPSSTVTESIVTDIDTSASMVGFGLLSLGAEVEGAQRFSVTTNSEYGYQLLVAQKSDLISNNGADIDPIDPDNESPSAWSISSSPSGFGYHAGDDTLSDVGFGSSRFAAPNTYAKFEDTYKEVAYSPIPVENDEVDLVYKIEVTSDQEAGEYSSNIVYVLVPTY